MKPSSNEIACSGSSGLRAFRMSGVSRFRVQGFGVLGYIGFMCLGLWVWDLGLILLFF